MGSGTNRAFWAAHGSRSGRKSNTKSIRARRKGDKGWMKMKALRAEAKRRLRRPSATAAATTDKG